MSIRKGNRIIASTGANGLQMFDFKWSDHTIDDLNWILSSPNSWHSGNTYKKMYNHLYTDFTNGSSRTDTIGTYTIPYILASDGHKIVDSEYESIAQDIFLSSGISWYYIIDTENKQFKLPRTKFSFESGSTSEIGEYVEPGLPNITGYITNLSAGRSVTPVGSGALSVSKTGTWSKSGTDSPLDIDTISLNASNSNSIYGNSDTVQPHATKMLLYFYTAEFAVNSSSGGGTVSITYDSTNQRLIFESGE